MNDYKELVENLRDDYEGWGEGRTQNFYEVTLRCKQAADAIEQLIKERDAKPVRHGHWVSDSTTFFCGTKRIEFGDVVQIVNGSPICSCHCSVCGEWLVASDEYAACGKYCPNCGAKMDEVSE